MADWNGLIEHLASGPREDGTAQLFETAVWLQQELARRGLSADAFVYTAHPWRLRTIGAVALLAACAYVFAQLKKRHAIAAVITLAVPLYIVAELDFGVALFGRLHSVEQTNVVSLLKPTGPATQRLIFSAHYDTKTDLLDHLVRTPITLLGLPLTLLMLIAALRPRPRLVKVAIAGALFNGLGLFLVQTAGAFVPARSPGAIDDGAGCMVLLELGSALAAAPLTHTEVQLVFFSGEEIGLEGSQQWVGAQRFETPTRVINLDGVGESRRLAVYKAESGVTRSFAPDPDLLALINAAHEQQEGVPLHRTFYPATTDARSFLEAGIPALNLGSDLEGHAIPRHMHSQRDDASRLSPDALASTLTLLTNVAHAIDSRATR